MVFVSKDLIRRADTTGTDQTDTGRPEKDPVDNKTATIPPIVAGMFTNSSATQNPLIGSLLLLTAGVVTARNLAKVRQESAESDGSGSQGKVMLPFIGSATQERPPPELSSLNSTTTQTPKNGKDPRGGEIKLPWIPAERKDEADVIVPFEETPPHTPDSWELARRNQRRAAQGTDFILPGFSQPTSIPTSSPQSLPASGDQHIVSIGMNEGSQPPGRLMAFLKLLTRPFRGWRQNDTEGVSPDHPSFEDTREHVRRLLENRILVSPADARDSTTGLPTRALINSNRGIQSLHERIDGPMVIVLADYNGMKAPNEFGLREQNDQLLASLPRIGRITLPADALLDRVGGDEILIIMGHDVRNSQATIDTVERFIREQNATRDRIFDVNDPRVQRSEAYAATRNRMREILPAVRSEFGDNYTEEQHRIYLVRELSAMSSRPGANPISFTPGQSNAELVYELAQARGVFTPTSNTGLSILGLSVGIVYIGRHPNSETINRALGQAEIPIHIQKERGGTQILRVEDLRPEIELRESERAAIATTRRIEQQFEIARAAINRPEVDPKEVLRQLIKATAADASTDKVLRFGVIRDLPVSDVFDIQRPSHMVFLRVDIPRFGAFNNQIGNTRGNEIFARLATISESFFGEESIKIRDTGGSFIIQVDVNRYPNYLQMSNDMQEAMSLEIGNALRSSPYRVRAEMEMSQKLDEKFGLVRGNVRLGRATVSLGEADANPNNTVGELFRAAGF